MKKTLIISILIFIVIALIPGYFEEHHWVGPRENNSYLSPNISCYAGCKGAVIGESCTKTIGNSKCVTVCLGIVYGNCGVNPISAKIKFISRLFK